MDRPAVICAPGEGRAIGLVGGVYRFLATGAQTDGKYATIEAIVPPGSGPPPHVHSREEESFWIMEGEMTFWLDEQRIVAGPGTLVNLPVGRPHRFQNETDKSVRMLITIAPAGLEEMFFEAGTPLPADAETAPAPTAEDIAKLLVAANRQGVEILVPQP